jgi:hypothetical protein
MTKLDKYIDKLDDKLQSEIKEKRKECIAEKLQQIQKYENQAKRKSFIS